jgi:hypothetical protein
MHFISIWVLYNFSLYTEWWRRKDEYFGGVRVLVIVRKIHHTNMCLILNGYQDRAVWIYEYKSIVNGNKERQITYW